MADEAQKISLEKAEKIIEAICDLMETQPLQLLNGRTGIAVRNLAQQIEDIGRPKAAARILKGWEILKASILKGAMPGDSKSNTAGL